jgi:hypothetical protein
MLLLALLVLLLDLLGLHLCQELLFLLLVLLLVPASAV